MSGHVAGKGAMSKSRKYTIEPKKTEFSDAILPEQAINHIMEKYGERPEDTGSGIPFNHQFAEIVSWNYAKIYPQSKLPIQNLKQEEMFPENNA